MPIHNPAEVDGDPGEGHITIGAWNYNTIVQGTWGFIVQAAMYVAKRMDMAFCGE